MKKKILLISLISLLLVSLSFNYVRVKADSGWDTDYDFGGSDWGSSDWDDDDWSSSGSGDWGFSSNSSGDDLSTIVFFIILGVIVVVVVKGISKNGKTTGGLSINSVTSRFKYIDENTIKEQMTDFNKEEFLNKAYINFLDVQNAWTNFSYDRLRELLSDELFNTYQSQLKALKLKKQVNMMDEFVKDFIDIKDFEYKDGKATVKVILLTSFYDYVTNTKGDVLRGTKANKVNNVYELTFISSEAKTKKSKKCPNCNAPLEDKVTNKCPYCHTTIIHSSYDWVLAKKEVISRYIK